MAHVLLTVRSLYGRLSKTHQQLADYLLKNSEEIPFQSVHQLARTAGVSVASVSRFARIVGYRSFKDFKIQLGKDSLATLTTAVYQGIAPEDSDEQIVEKVFRGNITSLEETLKILNRAELIRAAKLIATSPRTVFFGIGSSGNIAHDAALRFSQLDTQAEAYTDSYQILNQALRVRKDEVACGISHSGRSVATVQALGLAAENGAITIGIANYLKSPLHDKSRIFLCTSFPESQVKVAALSSRIAQMCLIDALYLLAARHKKLSLRKAEQLNRHVEKTLRFPAK
jgi:DNA-binding MurR/RpiR family transcriptional regulator